MKKVLKKTLSIVLTIAMLLSFVSVAASAIVNVADTELASALSRAKTYIDNLTINNSSNVPNNVVSRFGTQFTWDNEKRESANKAYLFEWSYYNGVVFEGLEDIYDYTKNSTYRNYVEAYMNAMIASNGTWAKTSNNASKDCAGYVDYHGADCYKTASLLIDMAKDANGNVNTSSKYYAMAETLYNDLTTGTGSGYSKSELGWNYWHSNWNGSTAPTYKVWLDGIYMIQPFMAEYAYYSNDAAQMSKIYNRFQWLYTNGRQPSTGLYYHAINSNTNYCNYFWTRAIGWYAMAVVDCMQYMSGSQLNNMKVILKDLIDNMLPYQDNATGMWANLCNNAVTSTNRLETSGSSMLAYAIAKGVNNGWLAESYGEYAKAAFTGIVNTKLSGNNLSDIYFKASASGSNNYETASNYLTNEGKGVGPFIMAYSEVLHLYDDSQNVPEPVDLTHEPTGIVVQNTTATAISVTDVTSSVQGLATFQNKNCVAYDIELENYTQGENVTVNIPIPSGMNASAISAYYIPENSSPVELVHSINNGMVSFNANHMSVYALADESSVTDTVNYPPFPEGGSVKIDKWATGDQLRNTGVGEVNLSLTAVPPFYSSSVDVLFVTDVSNSMYWKAGTKDNATGANDSSKLNDMQDAVAQFSDVLLAGNVPGDVHNNTISFVTFGGLDKSHERNTANVANWSTYADPTRTLFTSYDSYNAVTSAVNNIRYDVDSNNAVHITFDGSNGASNTSTDVSYGGTNYDYGFMEATSAISQIKADYQAKTGSSYDDSDREIYVIFVTDGAPTHYNGTMYRYDTDTTRPDKNETWTNPNGQEVVYVWGKNNNSNYDQAGWYDYIKNTDSYWATQVYNTPSVANISALGIDLDNGGFSNWVFTNASGYPLKDFVEGIVANQTLDVFLANDSAAIAQGLLEVAGQISSSTGSTHVIDTMGANFDIQMANTVNHTASGQTIALSDYNITPKITVKEYSTYHIGDVGRTLNGVTVTTSMIGQHINETPALLEEVTFNAAGTEAYSNNKSGNIMTNGVINAQTFIYNSTSAEVTVGTTVVPAKSIYWKIGSLIENERVITYNVYLEASMQGGRPEGIYDTNEQATLYYKNYLGNDCEKEYPVPNLPWDQAKLSYELYLVDANGNPVNDNGTRVSFDNRTVKSELVEVEKYLNTATTIDYNVLIDILPDGYMLYNENAYYSGIISSNDLYNNSTIGDDTNTTFVFNPTGTTIGSDGTVNGITDYTDIKVAFAIVKLGLNPDAVVIDYGKPIFIDPLANDVGNFVVNGLTTEAPRAGMNTAQSVKTANGVAAVQPGVVYEDVMVPVGNNLVKPFALNGTSYVYPSSNKVTVSNNTTMLRYAVEANGRITKYAANSTNGTQVCASLANGAYVIYDGYAFTNLNGTMYIVKNYELETTTTEVLVNKYYYEVDNNQKNSNTVTVGNRANARTEIAKLEDNTAITGYYSGTTRNRTVYIYKGSSLVLTMGTTGTNSRSGTFPHTYTDRKDITGTNIEINVSASRTGVNSSSIKIEYPKVVEKSIEVTETTTVETLKMCPKTGTEKVSFSLFNYLSNIETVYYYVSPEVEPAKNSDTADLLYSTIKVIPATSVYYEDDFGGSAENGGLYIQYTGNWYQINDDGTSSANLAVNTDIDDRQDNGEIGQGNVPYGYDSSYEGCNMFSNGSAMTVQGTVSKDANNKNQFDAYAEFTFTGTGFDIISRTDMNCGQITVAIYNSSNNLIANVPVINKGVQNLYQIPVISYTGMTYGTYRVRINVNAPQKFLNITGSTFYLDAIRIYNPMGIGTGNNQYSEANEAYYADKQANEYEASIRDYILSIGDLRTSETTGAVYVDTIDNEYSGGGLLNQSAIKDFQIAGPNEEVYITPGKGVGFALICSKLPESIQIEAKIPTPLNNAKFLVQTVDQNGVASGTYVEKTITSASEMFYDITDAVRFTQTNIDGINYYRAVVVLTNSLTSQTNDIISITNVKTTFDQSVTNIVEVKSDDELQTASVESVIIDDNADESAVAGLMASWGIYCDSFEIINTQYQASIPNYDVTRKSDFAEAAKGLKTTAEFTTSQFVDGLVVTDENGNTVAAELKSVLDESKIYTNEAANAKTWTVTITADTAGEHTYTVSAVGGEGTTATAQLTVTPAQVASIKVIKKPAKTEYNYGEAIDTSGLKLEVTYTDGTTQTVSSGYTLSTSTAKGSGSEKVTVTYNGAKASFTIDVNFSLGLVIKSIILKLFSFSWLRH